MLADVDAQDRSVARDQIRDLVARYNANGDAGRFDEVLALFADDAVMEIVGRPVHVGRAAIETVFTRAQDQLRGAATAGYVRHFTATHQIDLIDETHAGGRCYFAVLTPIGLDHWGRYIDEYVRREGRWLFARRTVAVDDHAPGSRYAAD